MLSFIQASLEFTFRDHLGILIEMLGIPSDGEHLPLFMGASCPTDVVASTYGQNGVLNALRSSFGADPRYLGALCCARLVSIGRSTLDERHRNVAAATKRSRRSSVLVGVGKRVPS